MPFLSLRSVGRLGCMIDLAGQPQVEASGSLWVYVCCKAIATSVGSHRLNVELTVSKITSDEYACILARALFYESG